MVLIFWPKFRLAVLIELVLIKKSVYHVLDLHLTSPFLFPLALIFISSTIYILRPWYQSRIKPDIIIIYSFTAQNLDNDCWKSSKYVSKCVALIATLVILLIILIALLLSQMASVRIVRNFQENLLSNSSWEIREQKILKTRTHADTCDESRLERIFMTTGIRMFIILPKLEQ